MPFGMPSMPNIPTPPRGVPNIAAAAANIASGASSNQVGIALALKQASEGNIEEAMTTATQAINSSNRETLKFLPTAIKIISMGNRNLGMDVLICGLRADGETEKANALQRIREMPNLNLSSIPRLPF